MSGCLPLSAQSNNGHYGGHPATSRWRTPDLARAELIWQHCNYIASNIPYIVYHKIYRLIFSSFLFKMCVYCKCILLSCHCIMTEFEVCCKNNFYHGWADRASGGFVCGQVSNIKIDRFTFCEFSWQNIVLCGTDSISTWNPNKHIIWFHYQLKLVSMTKSSSI